MKSTSTVVSVLALTALSVARPVPGKGKIEPREVPQEHSHEQFLTSVRDSLRIDNPDNIGDPVFGLLGNGVRLCSCHSSQNLFPNPITSHHIARP